MQKERYVFVCHCGSDAQVGGKVTYYLRERGLRVWYESWDTYAQSGDDVFWRELQATKFLLPVISRAALTDQGACDLWLSWLGKAGDQGLLVVPVLCEPEVLDLLPPALRDKKMIRLGLSFENDLNELIFATALDEHLQEVKKRERLTIPGPELAGFIAGCQAEMAEQGWPADLAVKEVVVAPLFPIRKLAADALLGTITSSAVKLAGWSGAAFPFPPPLGSPFRSTPEAVSYLDRHPWVGELASAYFWKLSTSGFFLARHHLHEDQCGETVGRYLSPEWLMIWISQALRFAGRLLPRLPDASALRLELRLSGMAGRSLLWSPRTGFGGDYRCSQPEITAAFRVDKKTDAVHAVVEAAQYFLERFGLVHPPVDALKRTATLLCDGRFYQLEI
ncbi:MAG: toll/interleukin-1 receptor domain-containing protein [Thermodesulfobacteriota bacterium]